VSNQHNVVLGKTASNFTSSGQETFGNTDGIMRSYKSKNGQQKNKQ